MKTNEQPKVKRARGRSVAGFRGEFRYIQHAPDPRGERSFWDDWEHDVVRDPKSGREARVLRRGPDGWPIPRTENVRRLRTYRNKILKRGISYMMHRSLSGHPGGPYAPSDITYGPTTNPFAAFFLAADEPTAIPAKAGDALVLWEESDGEFDAKVPVNAGNPGEGLRAILLSDTTGPGLRRDTIAYPTTAPYRQIEYTFYAQGNTPSYAAGTIGVVAGASMVDDEWFELDDGINEKLRFQYDSNASVADWDGDPANPVPIRFTAGDTQTQVRDATLEAINRVLDYAEVPGALFITATAGGGAGDVVLAHDKGGLIGNVTIVTSSTPAFSVSGMSGGGGGALETADDGIDNLAVKACGLSAGIQCGDGEGSSQIGIRTVLGKPAVLGPGIGRFIYEHEATPGTLHLYTGSETLGGVGTDGYVEDGHEEESEQGPTTADSSDQITAATKRFRVVGLDLTRDDVGKTARIASSGSGNDGDYTIASVLMKDVFTVAEAVTSDESGGAFTCEVLLANAGELAFDGDVSEDLGADVVELGQKWRSLDTTGPHWIGRVWQSSKDIKEVKIIMPPGTPIGQAPDQFRFQYLDVDKVSGVPANLQPNNDSHWMTIDSPLTSQGTTIFDAGISGVTYEFTVPPPDGKCYGIRVWNLQAVNASEAVEIAELYLADFEPGLTVTGGVDDVLRFSLDGGSNWLEFELGDYAVTEPLSADDLVDWLNSFLRGYGVEAFVTYTQRSLAFRSTTNGDNATLDLDTEGNGSTANSTLGFPSGGGSAAGATEIWRKFPTDPETIVYRAELSGDLS